jgi:hypothetical protein
MCGAIERGLYLAVKFLFWVAVDKPLLASVTSI